MIYTESPMAQAVLKAVRTRKPEAAMRGLRRLAADDSNDALLLAEDILYRMIDKELPAVRSHRDDLPSMRLLTMTTRFIADVGVMNTGFVNFDPEQPLSEVASSYEVPSAARTAAKAGLREIDRASKARRASLIHS